MSRWKEEFLEWYAFYIGIGDEIYGRPHKYPGLLKWTVFKRLIEKEKQHRIMRQMG